MGSKFATPLPVVCFIASLLVFSSRAAAFNPQPEPPGKWYVEGFIDMWADAMDPTDTAPPFGIDPDIVGDASSDFAASVIARFSAYANADDKPVDGLYDAEMEYFRLRIGDTTWDETMPGTMQFQVTDGLVTACSGIYTVTMPDHPDLSFALPSSPATWEAHDERGDVDLGVVTGTYSLRDGTVPEPTTLGLLALGGLAMIRRRTTKI